jgi:hypothetical protein
MNPKTLGTLRHRSNQRSISALAYVGAPLLGTGNLFPQMDVSTCQCGDPFTPSQKLQDHLTTKPNCAIVLY